MHVQVTVTTQYYGATSLCADRVVVVSDLVQPSDGAVSSTTQSRWNAMNSSVPSHYEISTNILKEDNSASHYEFDDERIGNTVRIFFGSSPL